ncbi:hypothetical protein C8Q77DRAFT_1070276 [Trametes polyzona]|nr:hypothetical protein C8Q77DRAFT_1070276 [Trametes polyzona]
MDAIPLEIAQRILGLACTDGGYTGYSISLASKTFRAIGRTTRFHSVLLPASPRRLQSFVALYERECSPVLGDKPRIQHLHVTFPRIMKPRKAQDTPLSTIAIGAMRNRSLSPPPNRRSVGVESPEPLLEKLGCILYTADTLAQAAPAPFPAGYCDPTAAPEYLQAVRTLFRLVTPDLVTLVVQCGFGSGGGPLHLPAIEGPFPNLTEVTFAGVKNPSQLFAAEEGSRRSPTTTPQQPLFPALTHLSLMPRGATSIDIPFWSAHAPRVTHLSVSSAESYVNDITSAVGVRVQGPEIVFLPEPSILDDDGPEAYPVPETPFWLKPLPPPAYPSIRYALLQPGPGPIEAQCGNPWIEYDYDLWILRWVPSSAEEFGVQAVVLEAPEDTGNRVYYDRARRGWLERIGDDSAGYWRELEIVNSGRVLETFAA